ncbi:MAG: hypothetical protein KDK64_08500, partial [Chlamydiia bacterium]|nr:hypothetical protein [Chlamydiia bacterium]
MNIQSLLLPLLFILGASAITMLTKALQILGRIQSKKEFKKKPHYFFVYTLIQKLFSQDAWDNLFYLLSFTKHLLRLLYSTSFLICLLLNVFNEIAPHFPHILIAIAIIAAVALAFDFFFRFVVGYNPSLFLRIVTPLTSFFLLLFSPITFPLLKLQQFLFHPKQSKPHGFSRARVKDKILELAHESELSLHLDPFDRRTISAVASMRDRIVREIMVPRIDIFSLSVNQTVHEAAQKFISEGYSR